MHFSHSFILLTITASFILIADRTKAEKTEKIKFRCKGKLFDRKLGSRQFQKIQHNLNDITLPERFDSREKWPHCKSLHHIKFQGDCGGCWAFASASVMSDRLCIATEGKYNKIVSEQDLMECCNNCVPEGKEYIGGCEGGYLLEAFQYWEEHGLVTGYEGCKPTENDIVWGVPQKECRQRCTNESYKVEYETDRTFSVKTFMTYPAEEGDIEHIMAEIMLNGPVCGVVSIPTQASEYFSTVPREAILKLHESLADAKATGHAIKIIGWDYVRYTPVWIIANSWGRKWCKSGFCYVRRGQNDFKIEVMFNAGIPKMHITKKKQKKKIEKTESSSSIVNIPTNPIELAVILCILKMSK